MAGVFAGCGNNSPAYCSDRTSLQNSIKSLTHFNTSNGISGLKSQLKTVQSDAAALVNSAKSDFPSQTSAYHFISRLTEQVRGNVASVDPSAGDLAARLVLLQPALRTQSIVL